MPFVKLQDKHNKKSQICLIGRVVVIVELSRTSGLFLRVLSFGTEGVWIMIIEKG